MEIKHIKELMAAMGRTGTKKLMLKKEDFELQLERQENGKSLDSLLESTEDNIIRQENALHRAALTLSRSKETSLTSSGAVISSSSNSNMEESIYVTSPMVGTFYSSPSPDDPSFVKPGDKIEKHTVVCIIEAMKVMNEVKAGISGTIAEILVESGHPVEFGTKLFRII